MAEENIPAAPAPAPDAAATPAAQLLPAFICAHTVQHNGETYRPGDRFVSSDPAVIEHLRSKHAILLPNEIESAESVAERLARLEAERDELRRELEAHRSAAQAAEVAAASRKSGKAERAGE